jgi:hypothetical protein
MNFKSIVCGAAAGVVAFFGLSALKAQTVLTVRDYHHNQKAYVGSQVEITGIATNIRQVTKRVNNQDVPYTSLNLNEQDNKGRKGKYYVWVSIPSRQFTTQINDGDPARIVGTMKWPYQIGMIEE